MESSPLSVPCADLSWVWRAVDRRRTKNGDPATLTEGELGVSFADLGSCPVSSETSQHHTALWAPGAGASVLGAAREAAAARVNANRGFVVIERESRKVNGIPQINLFFHHIASVLLFE